MNKRLRFSVQGNGLLELLLALPLGLLILFGALDGGLHLLGRGQVNNTIRTSLRRMLPAAGTTSERFQQTVLPRLVEEIARELRGAHKGSLKELQNVLVEAALVQAPIDAFSGALQLEPAATRVLRSRPLPAGTVPRTPQDAADFLQEEFKRQSEERPSRFAVPLPSGWQGSGSRRYLERCSFLYLSVRGRVRGSSASRPFSALQAIDEQQLVSLLQVR